VIRLCSESPAQTHAIATALAGVLLPGDVVVLAGDLGAGKTTFVQGAAHALGSDDVVTSPTFAIVQEYAVGDGAGARRIAHVDAYRLQRVQELHDIGFDELLDGSTIVFVEWGDRVVSVLPDDRLTVTFALDFDSAPDTRTLTVAPLGDTWSARATALQHALAPFAGEGGA
jgi:tRNA threonylcarbamoyladenosine biosynthesis protein TsaE